MIEQGQQEIPHWSDSDWHQIKHTQFETDLECYESLVVLMGDAGNRLQRPVWSDYDISAITAEGEV